MTDESAPKPEAKIVSSKERSTTVALDWPVEFDGQMYESITIRRCSGKEVDEFVTAATAGNGSSLKAPMIDCPQEVYEAMDDDDRLKLEAALVPFLPRRLTKVAELIRQTAAITSAQ